MQLSNVAIPLGLAWSSPFCRWQGALAGMSSVDLVVDVTGRALAARGFDVAEVGHVAFGTTVPQPTSFYGVTTVTPRLGLAAVTGPTIAQACATSAAVVQAAAVQVELGAHRTVLALTTDRTSNGPLMVWSAQATPGAAPLTEHWVLDPMKHDPNTGGSMLDTAENVAAEQGYTRAEIDEVTLLRHEQYRAARSGPRDYLVEVHVPGRRGEVVVADDAGVHDTTAEGLAKLSAVRPDGVVSYGSQTHPGDGTAGLVLSSVERARELAGGAGVARIHAVAFARVRRARMPEAPVPAARAALADAGLDVRDLDVVTTHNPFAVNDIYFSRQTGFPLDRMNPYGCSLVYGHPQGPTGMRAVAELVAALRDRGGGRGLFTGCAAGDTAGAVVVEVTD
ncbi:thiolase family protein [Micromonospora sp. WMMD1102]|uniref:thiolase family protein n=1 Tax=Micromonospora sp. WMMD1102 TaxID=3016105 RepID=UPI0024154113|nr:thiolase family protein [Micromonospora sp. WMMD1102]MDG4785341.1 thiolase family protein [Micromonospora sp. WMMD1102]